MNVIASLSQNISKGSIPQITKSWLRISVGSLALAGLVAIILILARTPILQNYIPYSWFFKSAMVVHVDLSVLFWLLSVSAMMFSSITSEKYYIVANISVKLAIIAMCLVTISPFVGDNQPLMNNYIPVLVNLCFFLGISCFACAILFQAIICILSFKRRDYYNYYICSIALIVVVSFIAFVMTYFVLKQDVSLDPSHDRQHYFELLFWGGGHLLQFAYTQLMQLSWLILARVNLNNKYIVSLFTFNILATIPCLMKINDSQYISFFTEHMRYFGGITSLIIAIYLVVSKKKISYITYSSMLLFASGGIIGFMITTSNVTIPAHYHGSVVGVTISYMGLVYLFMKDFGFKMPSQKSLSYQPILLGLGQLIHVLGLTFAGGYGALRKHPGLSGDLKSQIGMGIMAVGGLMAVAGGIIFIINSFPVLKEIFTWKKKQKN